MQIFTFLFTIYSLESLNLFTSIVKIMQRILLKSKLHRVTATCVDLNYEGSCAIDEDLLDAADILVNERVDIWNVNNGARFSTYAIRGERGSGVISINGSAARNASPGDILIIATFANFDESEIATHQPRLIYVDAKNRIVRKGHDIPVQAG